MKTIFKIHPLCYIVWFIAFLTGFFKETIIIMSIILIHELGHILMGFILKWKIKEVIIMPFGGLTVFKENLNKSLKEELAVAIAGPLMQTLTFFLKDNQLYINYSIIILLVNLLPIYPLDGAKIINVFLNKIFSFKKSHKLVIYISLIVTIAFFLIYLIKINLIYLLFLMLLLFKILDENKNHLLIFEHFLYERWLYKLKFKKIKIVKNTHEFKKDYYHFINYNNKLTEEALILKKKFDFKE